VVNPNFLRRRTACDTKEKAEDGEKKENRKFSRDLKIHHTGEPQEYCTRIYMVKNENWNKKEDKRQRGKIFKKVKSGQKDVAVFRTKREEKDRRKTWI
jgi:hypothetical protein